MISALTMPGTRSQQHASIAGRQGGLPLSLCPGESHQRPMKITLSALKAAI